MIGPRDAIRLSVAVGAGVAGGVARAAERGGLAALDAVLASDLAREATDRVLSSALAELLLRRLLAGPLVDAVGEDIPRYRVIERVSDPIVASGGLERLVETSLASAALDRVLERVVDSPAAERLVARVIDGPLLDAAVSRLLESEDLWLLVDAIARSPAVTEAIGHQGVGFAEQVAGAVRDRSHSADDRLESAVRRLVRRRRSPVAESDRAGA